jgi:predicted HAD superfamily phosphohydrolase
MLQAVDDAGGLAIAFNANKYALPYATMSLASTSIHDLTDIMVEWSAGYRKKVEKTVRDRERSGGSGDRGHFHWLAGRENRDEVVEIHRRIRKLVREEAGKLG